MRRCTEYEDMISAFIDGALAEDERAALMEHMAACPACQEYFDQQIALHDAMLADAEEIQPPEDFAADVMARVRFTPQNKRKKPVVRWQQWVALAACCAIAAVALWRGTVGTRQVNMTRGAADCPAAPAESVENTARAADKDGGTDAAAPEPAAAGTGSSTPEAPAAPPVTGSTPPDEAASTEGSPDSEQQIAPQANAEPETTAELPDEKRIEQRDGLTVYQAMPAPAAGMLPDTSADDTAALSGGPEAAQAPCTIVTASPAAAAWVEETLGLAWTAGGRYELTEEEYLQLRKILEDAGEDFTEQPGDEDAEQFLLIAESGPETDE